MGFTDFGNRKWKDHLKGGNADNKTPDNFNPDDIVIGTKVEREHTNNPDIATEIAMDHLAQDDSYYDKLITSGIADEEDAINLYDELKGINNREKSKKDIDTFMNSEDDYDEVDDDEDYEEDELGTDKVDYDENEDELIFDKEDPKNKRKIMEKSILKNYKSFISESIEEGVPSLDDASNSPTPGPERKYSKENKYKFQIPYDKKIVDKLNEYNFIVYVPDGEKEVKSSKFIIIDILNLNYSLIGEETPDVRHIDPSKLKNILENL